MSWDEVLATLPLIAILRGIRPGEALGIGEALVGAGFRCIEIPLNSPDPLNSIRRLREGLGRRALVGAGTVLNVEAVNDVAEAGGQIVVSPNCDPAVIAATKARGMAAVPAFFTPSEAFTAIEAGADGLKLFPAEAASPAVLKAIRAVLPDGLPVMPVGGIEPDGMAAWRKAGAAGFGIGGALYAPGRSAQEVGERARRFVEAWRKA
jgi:2-dehydro-3-deoxyphosphogalactonate aldolase